MGEEDTNPPPPTPPFMQSEIFMKLKVFVMKNTINKIKDKKQSGRKICTTNISGKELISIKQRASININVKEVKPIRIVKPRRKKYKWPVYIKS